MKRICCECGKVYGEKPGEGVTHGYCPECEDKIRRNLGLAPRKTEKNRPYKKANSALLQRHRPLPASCPVEGFFMRMVVHD